jgi:hypothetical protein
MVPELAVLPHEQGQAKLPVGGFTRQHSAIHELDRLDIRPDGCLADAGRRRQPRRLAFADVLQQCHRGVRGEFNRGGSRGPR